MSTARSGRDTADVTLDSIRLGEVTMDDVTIHPETLVRQAQVAREHANPQLAENLLRAAELTLIPDAEVLAMYEALRPGRSTGEELRTLSASLRDRGAPRTAALIDEAADAYTRRGITKQS
ncbi:MAG: diol dehydratase small subunit [Actinomycetes bacterium]|jgi:propanediol dehydratase small subunit